MNDIHLIGLRLNSVTGSTVKTPAVSPDTLRELAHPYYGFLQTYSLSGESTSWHGQLKNIRMQYSIPFSIVLPPRITEMLQLDNDDTIILKSSHLSEARNIYYKRLNRDLELVKELPELHPGMEIGKSMLCTRDGIAIELIQWEPEGCFFGPERELIETKGTPKLKYSSINQIAEVSK